MTLQVTDDFFIDVTIRRASGVGSFVKGIYQEPGTSDFAAKASLQPLRPEELVNLPEAQRNRKSYKVYTEVELKTAVENGAPADILIFSGTEYEIQGVEQWVTPGLDLPHYKSIAVKLD